MGTNKFTKEQMEQLRLNPYIEKVSETTITYTTAFKERFHQEYQEGKTPSTILLEMGIDPTVLGKKRRSSLVTRMKAYANRSQGYEDLRGKHKGKTRSKELSEAELIKKLEHRILILEQENDFFKKNELLEWNAEIRAKRKQRQQKNSNSFID